MIQIDLQAVVPRISPFELGCHVKREREKKKNRVLIPCHAFSLDLFSEMLIDRQTKECLKILIQIDLQAVVPRISPFELGCHVRREREQTNLIYSLDLFSEMLTDRQMKECLKILTYRLLFQESVHLSWGVM